MKKVICSHCGERVDELEAIPCKWIEHGVLLTEWFYCAKCDSLVFNRGMFSLGKLEPCMLVEIFDKNKNISSLCMTVRTYNSDSDLVLSSDRIHAKISDFNKDSLEDEMGRIITKIFSISEDNMGAHNLNTTNRRLLWDRKWKDSKKKMERKQKH